LSYHNYVWLCDKLFLEIEQCCVDGVRVGDVSCGISCSDYMTFPDTPTFMALNA